MRTTLKKDEKLLIIIRQHWMKLILPVIVWLIISAIVIFAYTSHTTGLTPSIVFIVILITALYPMLAYINWKYNLWAVTNMRVVDESGFFTRYSKESPLDKINNVEYDQSLMGRVFGYGDVDIQTAAEMGETSYHMIHHPKLLKDTITHGQEEYKQLQITSQATQLAEAIAKSNAMMPGVQPSQQMVADELHKLFDLFQRGAITQEEYNAQKNKLIGK